MTDIKVRHDRASGTAVIEIRDDIVNATRLRLRDLSSGKYLAKRGWTKAMSFLPVDPTLADGVLTVTLDAELTSRISRDTKLEIEQPSTGLQEAVPWDDSDSDIPAAAPLVPPALADEATDDDQVAKDEPILIDPIEPPVVATAPEADQPQREGFEKKEEAGLFSLDEDEKRSRMPFAIVSALCVLLGMGIAYLLVGSGASDAGQAMSAQSVSEKTAPEQQAAASSDQQIKDANAKLAKVSTQADQVLADREAREKLLADNQSAITALNKKLADADAAARSGQQQLAERDKALRDLKAQLSVANVQIDALKVVAGKSTEGDLEKSALAEQVAKLTAELDKSRRDLADTERSLGEADKKLKDAENRLAAPGTETNASPANDSSDLSSNLQKERDLYAEELKTMTKSFSTLQAEKTELQKSVAALQRQLEDTPATAGNSSAKSIWGATAIDQAGVIYALQNQTTEKAAQDNVMAVCRGKSKFRCASLATYSNACFSVARFQGEAPASDNYAYFVHKSWKTSASTALERCGSMGSACTLRLTACSPDALSKPLEN